MSTDTERRELIRPDATIAYWVSGPERAPVVVLLHGATLDHRAWDAQVDGADAAVPRRRARPARARGVDAGGCVPVRRRGRRRRGTAGRGRHRGAGRPRGPEPGRQHRPGDRAPRPRTGCDALVVADSTLQHRVAPPAGRAADDRHAVGDGAGRPRAVHAARGGGHLAARRRAPVRPGRQRGPHDRSRSCRSSPRCWTRRLHPEPDYRLPVPTLLLDGADDRVGDIAAGSQEWAARDPMVELVVIPGAGHASNQDNPAAFTAALTAFLDRALPVPARASMLRPVERAARGLTARRPLGAGPPAHRPAGPRAFDPRSPPGPARCHRGREPPLSPEPMLARFSDRDS